VDIYLCSPNTPSWRGAQLKHRVNFHVLSWTLEQESGLGFLYFRHFSESWNLEGLGRGSYHCKTSNITRKHRKNANKPNATSPTVSEFRHINTMRVLTLCCHKDRHFLRLHNVNIYKWIFFHIKSEILWFRSTARLYSEQYLNLKTYVERNSAATSWQVKQRIYRFSTAVISFHWNTERKECICFVN